MNPVRRLRRKAGVTQKALAQLAGTSQPTIASYEAGTKSPTLGTVERLARSLGLEATIEFAPPLTREDRRSLAYHRALVEKLKSSPHIVTNKARANLEMLRRKHPDASPLFDRWEQWLGLSLEDLVCLCLDPGTPARDMRQVTPFAGLLDARERLEILEQFRERETVG
ncbi:MAG: helix-turn-helix domain-containing protein [Candidatus Binatia bacterium]